MERVENYGSMIEQVYLGSPTKSAFDRSHHNYLSGKLGVIIPTRLDEMYPGDRVKGHIQGVVNFEPLAAPIMGNMRYKQESFYVPDSILWKDAHKFYTGKKGFNTPKPSVSPKEVFDSYNDAGLLPWPYYTSGGDNEQLVYAQLMLLQSRNHLYDDPDDINAGYDGFFIDQALPEYVRDAIITYADKWQARDLFQPLLDLFDEYFFHKNDLGIYDNKAFNLCKFEKDNGITTPDGLTKLLCQFMCDYYSFIFGASSMMDYLGFPTFVEWDDFFLNQVYTYMLSIGEPPYPDPPFNVIANLFSEIPLVWLPFRAAYVVWYWNYRDELLETEALDPESDSFLSGTVSQDEMILLTMLRYRCWYKDTFTTALTNTGNGNLGVPIINSDELGENTNYVYYDSLGHTMDNVSNHAEALQNGAALCGLNIGGLSYKIPMNYFNQQNYVGGDDVTLKDSSFLSLDLFERIKRLQKFVQKKLILGYEYDDVVWSSFLVKLSNVRMRIPEILGRGSDLVELNTVVNNTNTAEQIAGDKTAIAWAQGRQSDINYFAEEHGYFLSFMTILPIQSYTGGMQRLWLKREQFDVMWPEFATMGMDAVYNCELSAPNGAGALKSSQGLTDEQAMAVFGYQGRYYDLKCRQDEEHGRMRTDLSYMTFARHFNAENLPTLNYIFVHCHPSTDMFVVNDPKEDIFKADIYHALDFERRLPVPSDFV